MFKKLVDIGYNALKIDGTTASLRTEGDLLRDAGHWLDASLAYKKYLERNPRDFGIWIQYGNCSKEAGAYEVALEAYETAIQLRGEDADAHLQLGHLHKLRNDLKSAAKAYQRSLDLDVTSPAFSELVKLGIQPNFDANLRTPGESKSRTIYIDITDILVFLENNINLSGIQRVIASVFDAVVESPLAFGATTAFCYLDRDSGHVRMVNMGAMQAMFTSIYNSTATRDTINAGLNASKNRTVAPIRPSDVFLILGAFWISPSYIDALKRLRANDVRVGLYIYDLIPITHKQFVDPGNGRTFRERLPQLLALCDFAITISEFVAMEAAEFAYRALGRSIPIKAVTLAHQLEQNAAQTGVGKVVADIIAQPFVLCVGTLEGRKNHMYLVEIWEQLLASRYENVPRLVFVGRWGWRIDALRDRLQQTDFLDEKVLVLSSLADSELTVLYQYAMFTMFPSFVEGWGLPIGESLAHGTPCIASRTSSMPEVGGDFVRYLDPNNVQDGKEQVLRALDDPQGLADWAKRIRKEFVPRKWSAVAADLGMAIQELTQPDSHGPSHCALPVAEIIPLSLDGIEHIADAKPSAHVASLLCSEGWHQPERRARWSLHRQCAFQFWPQGVRPDTQLRLALHLQLPPRAEACMLVVRSGTFETVIELPNSQPRWYFCAAWVDQDGRCDVTFSLRGRVRSDPKRRCYLGLKALAMVDAANIEQRFTMMEMIQSYAEPPVIRDDIATAAPRRRMHDDFAGKPPFGKRSARPTRQ